MGSIASRQNERAEEADVTSNHAYKYPPRSGNYFANHFIMGGEKFDTPQPEAYLFGENTDLNFLGCRPTPFPYPPPQPNEPTKTLKSLVNIRKESLRFVRCPNSVMKVSEMGDGDVNVKGSLFNIEFTFDCDAKCSITIYYFCTEEVTANSVIYHPKDPSTTSPTYRYKKGANQQFCQISHVFDPSKYHEDELLYNIEKEIIPIAIHCVVDEQEGGVEMMHSHTTIAVVEKHSDGTYVLKALKQKIFVDGLNYLLQEIYGIENKNIDTKVTSDSETEDGGSECVICMCDVRDTLILPCRHLCLCNSCADSLRYQANNCPICRAPFRALLQIKALKKSNGLTVPPLPNPPDASEHIPPGYEAVSLIEALNGPSLTRAQPLPTTPPSPDNDASIQAANKLNRCTSDMVLSGGSMKKPSKNSLNKENDSKVIIKDKTGQSSEPEFRMSNLLAREEANDRPNGERLTAHSPLLIKNHTTKIVPADKSKKHIVPDECCNGGTVAPNNVSAEKLAPLLVQNGVSPPNGAVLAKSRSQSPECSNGCVGSPVGQLQNGLQNIDLQENETEPDGVSTASNESETPSHQEENQLELNENGCDYFTPQDSTTSVQAKPAKQADTVRNNFVGGSSESTPQRWALRTRLTSLPGTPISSGDSYGSSSSTRQLLSASNVSAPLPTTDAQC